MRAAALAVIALLGLAGSVSAQEQPAPAACASTDAALPAEWAAWTRAGALTAATASGGLGKAALTPGQAVNAVLAPTPNVKFVVQPEKPGGSVSKAGMFELKVETAGRYAIALNSAAWLDVLDAGKAAAISVAHGRGPACSSLRKIVEFDLKPGRYVIQVSANPDPSIKVMVARRS